MAHETRVLLKRKGGFVDARDFHEVREQEAVASHRPAPKVNVGSLPPKDQLDPEQPFDQLCFEHKEVRALITSDGKIRKGLSNADRKKAQEILNRYGG